MTLNIAILGSTSGTDMQAIIDSIDSGNLPNVEIKFVLSNKENAFILERAKKHNLKGIFLDPKDKTKEEYDKEISQLIEDHDVELILLIGYMKFMSGWFVNKYLNKVMNIHPSLLPLFAGKMNLNVHKEIIDHGCKITGASLIFIDEGADTGPIISQKAVPVIATDTPETLKDKVQAAEAEIILKGIELFRDNKITVKGRIVHIDE